MRPDLIHLTADGVSALLDVRRGRLPALVHWGAALGPIDLADATAIALTDVRPPAPSSPDDPVRLAVLPEQHTGWLGRPGLSGSRDGESWSPWFRVTEVRTGTADADGLITLSGGGRVELEASDDTAQLGLELVIELSAAGVLRAAATLTNRGATYRLDDLSLAFPLPARAHEVLDFGGRWAKERTPQRGPLNVGIHLREGRRGRTGPDAATLLTVGEAGFGFAHGEVWGAHVGFSGNHRHYAERLSSGEQVIGGGELLLPGEIVLEPGESYRTPWVYGVYGDGLDDQARRLHRHLRARPQHPRRPRPVTLNVWEAVYFDHDLPKLLALAERAATVGVERYVLDDGWFRGRRTDRAGLGDWYVDDEVWPDGLTPLVDHVTALGMEFGLWFEPEMVNADSDLARAHPEWIMQTGGRLPVEARHQQVLNLGIPEAYAYVRDRMVQIIAENDVRYVKWDHNRDLVDAGTAPGGAPGVHEQTLAAYRLMAELKERFPGLEIESCSSGGARVDLGVIEHTDRVWVSDCNDPFERQEMMRWTQQLLPPELLGAHIASPRSHTTHRVHDLGFRAGSAFFGHFGIEWDITRAGDSELDQLTEWIALHKQYRELLHHGELVRMDPIDPTLWVHGVVAPDKRAALFAFAFLGRSDAAPLGRATLRGLDDGTRYRVALLTGEDSSGGQPVPAEIVLPGRALRTVGVQVPLSHPDTVWLFRVEAEEWAVGQAVKGTLPALQ
ncbi:alpha-galactosidase [Leifsonia sp. fls2-241-R2A-40a]|uniref:alpha-galactosidase n=1 Tax=Leifsonia sp. fls2-241-R2A-40a TaxID=3040290 RepID=UPI00254C957E|nr:alpha-galactosidase [Leifsonia sp. fls2-241-R2A-40a]